MPGLDGTGPWGMGPMTGRGLGWCNPYGAFGRGWRGRGRGRGLGFGRGFGRGRGFGWRWFAGTSPYGPYYPPYNPSYEPPYQMRPEEEVNMLKENAEALREELNAIEKRIAELEANK